MRTRVLVLTFDPLTDAMAGPAIRAWHLAQVLAPSFDVTLASTVGATRSHDAMRVCSVAPGPNDMAALVAACDVVFAPTSAVRRHPEIASATVPVVIDMYIPTHLENLDAGGAPTRSTTRLSLIRCRLSTMISPGATTSSVPATGNATSGSVPSPMSGG